MSDSTDPNSVARDIKRRTRRKFSSEEKIRIVLEGLKGENSIAEICRRENIHQNLYYKWSKDFLEAGKKRLAGDTMRKAITDVQDTLDLVLAKSGRERARVVHRPRLLSDNGPCYLSKELKTYLQEHEMVHTRGKPYHPTTQGKIERYHRTMKNLIKLDHYYFPEELERALSSFVHWYNNERYHESLQNLKTVDVYEGRTREILTERERIKRRTMRQRRQQNLRGKAPHQRPELNFANSPMCLIRSEDIQARIERVHISTPHLVMIFSLPELHYGSDYIY